MTEWPTSCKTYLRGEKMMEKELQYDFIEVKEVSDAALFPLNSQTPQMLYSLNEGGSVFYNYITCRKVGKFYAFTQAIIPPSQWEKDKQQIANIILSAKERNHS